MSTLPVIADVEIAVDSEGRYNLNALHKASGEGDEKRPSQWLRRDDAKAFIQAVLDQNADLHSGTKSITYEFLKVINGGNAPGTFAHELIAVEYAGWISPAFRIKVNQTFIDYRTGKLTEPAKPKYPPIKEIGLTFATCIKIAKLCGLKGNQAALSADKGTKEMLGISALALIGATHLLADAKGVTYTPTELGKLCEPPMSARQVNLALERAGLQKKELDHWLPTDAAIGHFEWVDTGKKHSTGAPVKQIRWFQSALTQLGNESQAA